MICDLAICLDCHRLQCISQTPKNLPTDPDEIRCAFRADSPPLTPGEVPALSPVIPVSVLSQPTRFSARSGQMFLNFRNASAFASWLGLCPDRQISGRVLYTKSRRVRNRLALALRMGANSLHHANNYLGEFFRRITRKLGKPQAITATAHKLARIVFHLLNTKEPYNESVFHKCEQETLKRAELRLRKHAAQLGFLVIPATNT